LLLGAALLFWGWENGLPAWGALMAVVVEGANFAKIRWEFSDADLNRVWDLCALLFMGLALIIYTTEEGSQFAFKLLEFLPVTFLPILLAQTCGSREAIPFSVLSWFLRRAPGRPLARKTINISYPYFALCLLGAAATTLGNIWFFPGFALLIMLALVAARPDRLPFPAWILLVGCIAIAGGVTYQGMHRLQSTMEVVLAKWIAKFFRPGDDARESRTEIGHLGHLSLSSRIAFRVSPVAEVLPPRLLQQGVYDLYRKETWWATSNQFAAVPVSTNDVAVLQPPTKRSLETRIAGYFYGGRGLLALPRGTFKIEEIPVALLTNRLGIVKADGGAELLNVVASYGPDSSMDAPPGPADMNLPEEEKAVLNEVVAGLHLSGLSNRQKARAIQNFFRDNFSYTLNLGKDHIDPTGKKTPLGQFLTVARSGHCEYFATATVLLLREAGVPARYATGYAVTESSLKRGTYLVRERHRHAWALIYQNDIRAWEVADNTPSKWEKEGETDARWWEPLSDFMSNIYFQFSKWRWSKVSYTHYVGWLLGPLILLLVWRIATTQRRRQKEKTPPKPAAAPWPGFDSELYQLDRYLARMPNETLLEWQRRLEFRFPTSARLDRAFRLHRSLRFDPAGLTEEGRGRLKSEVEEWVASCDVKSTKFQAPSTRE